MKSFFFNKEKLPAKPKNIELLQSLIGGFVSIIVSYWLKPFNWLHLYYGAIWG
nr:hypothetical protein [Gilliamella apicola]